MFISDQQYFLNHNGYRIMQRQKFHFRIIIEASIFLILYLIKNIPGRQNDLIVTEFWQKSNFVIKFFINLVNQFICTECLQLRTVYDFLSSIGHKHDKAKTDLVRRIMTKAVELSPTD